MVIAQLALWGVASWNFVAVGRMTLAKKSQQKVMATTSSQNGMDTQKDLSKSASATRS
jgi:hypothetical protein